MVAVGYLLHLGDFATYMLGIFLSNLMMYLIFYIVMKVINVFIPPFVFSSKLNKYEEATVNLKKCELAHKKSKDLISKIKI